MWFSRKLSYAGSWSILYIAVLVSTVAGCKMETGQEIQRQDNTKYSQEINDIRGKLDDLGKKYIAVDEFINSQKKDAEKKILPGVLERQLEDANTTIAEREREIKRLQADYARVQGYLYDKQKDKFEDITLERLRTDPAFKKKYDDTIERIKPGPIK